jgi:hypothetical protein
VYATLGLADPAGRLELGTLRYPFADSLCRQHYSSDWCQVVPLSDSTLLAHYYNRDWVQVHDHRNGRLLRQFRAESWARALPPPLPECHADLTRRPLEPEGTNYYAYWSPDTARGLHLYSFLHGGAPVGGQAAEGVAAAAGLPLLDSAFQVLGEGLAPPGWVQGWLHPPALLPGGWYFFHRGESLALGDTAVVVRARPRLAQLPPDDLRAALDRRLAALRGAAPGFAQAAPPLLGLRPNDTLPAPLLLLDPGKLCPACVDGLLAELEAAAPGALALPLAISFHPAFHPPGVRARLARVAARHGAPADSSGALSDHFLPGHGSAWLYYPSRAKGRWLRAEVPIHRVLPALRGHWLPPLEP